MLTGRIAPVNLIKVFLHSVGAPNAKVVPHRGRRLGLKILGLQTRGLGA